MKRLLLFSFIVLCIASSHAQKSSPVMGDAALLIDLLEKDYNIINPDTRDEDINMDRAKVLGIFKSYLEDSKKAHLTIDAPNTILKNAFEAYSTCKEGLNTLSKINLGVQNGAGIDDAKTKLIQSQNDLLTSKKNYFKLKYEFDKNEFDGLLAEYADNSYLYYILTKFKTKYENLQTSNIDSFAEKNAYSSVQKSIPFIGGDLAFETIIDGLARFLAKRIKEELTLHAIDKIKTYLENPTPENYCHELLVLLPTTTNYLKTFQADKLLNFTDELKQYIEQDLNELLENAVNLKNTPRFKSYIEKNPDLDFAFEGLEIIPQLSKIKSPIDYFEILENSRNLNRWKDDRLQIGRFNIAQSLRLASMLAYSMTTIDNGETKFVSVDFLSNYGNESSFYYLYFGMLHQQNIKYYNISFLKTNGSPNTLRIDNLMANANPFDYSPANTDRIKLNFDFLKSNLIPIVKNAEAIYNQALLIKKKNKNNEEVKYEEIYGFVDDIIGFAENTVTTSELLLNQNNFIIADNTIKVKEKLDPFFTVAKTANSIILDLHEKKYSNAIVRAIEIPLSFRNTNSTTIKIITNLKDNISNQKDLFVLNRLYDPKVTELTDAEKVKYLTALSSDLTILKLKISNDKNLKEVYDQLQEIDISSTLNTGNVGAELVKINALNPILLSKYEILMEHFGYRKSEIDEKIDQVCEEKKLNPQTKKEIKEKLSKYSKDLFEFILLNNTAKNPYNIENDLNALVTAFIPQLLESNSKMNDSKALKLIHLLNDISVAKDAEEVEKAIESFALPVGSSSLKEKASSYASINSFPGILFGMEHSDLENDKNAFTVGFTAPVGIYFHLFNNYKSGVWGIFIPVIDIAAPVRLRLDSNKDTQNLPDFNFKDIFSPGFYLTYGFGKSPFALNFGIQSGPKLRDISEDGSAVKDINSFRVSAGIVIDIPLFTLFSKYND